MCLGKQWGDESGIGAAASPMKDLDTVLGSWLQLGPEPATPHFRSELADERSPYQPSFHTLPTYLCNFQTNKS